MSTLERLEALAMALPEAQRVDIEAWGDEHSYRIRGKNFVFADQAVAHMTVKLSTDEAAAVVATERWVTPCGYGLGRHGWVTLALGDGPVSDDRWQQIEEWVRISYTLVAPKSLARLVLEAEGMGPASGLRGRPGP
jgi:predicted DNA-binding protein (MmcQ/YjbR family)